MQVFFYIAYFVVGFAQIFAIVEFFEKNLNWGFLDVLLALFVTYIPLVGSILGVLGAMDGWGWDIWQAGLLFFWYVPVFLLSFFYISIADR
jgi:hypothetical protein